MVAKNIQTSVRSETLGALPRHRGLWTGHRVVFLDDPAHPAIHLCRDHRHAGQGECALRHGGLFRE